MTRFNKLYCIQIISADVMNLLSKISLSGIEVQSIEWIDLLTINVKIESKHIKKARNILSSNDANWKVIGKEGSLWIVERIWKHPVLLIGFALFMLIVSVVPNRIFFVDVTGNLEISEQEILENAEKAGIKFGALASDIRSEAVKNNLLQSMPQLQWVGMITRGCVAEIQVKERSVKQMESPPIGAVSSIVAICDGVITQQTVYEGNPLYQIGDAVSKGDVLVSGYVDCGIKQRAGRSNAEVYAFTTRENKFISLLPAVARGPLQASRTCYKLRIGKKVINLCNHSGIMDTCCGKMYLENYWSFPGGFRLPVSLISVTHMYYGVVQPLPVASAVGWLPQFAQEYVTGQMISGKILHEELKQEEQEAVNILTGTYACHEMIGREKYEGILE